MFLRSVALALMLGSLLPSGQQAVPPPPKPTDSAPSLDVTLRFIQQKIGDLGNMYYMVFGADSTNSQRTATLEVLTGYSSVRYDLAACQISYHVSRRQGTVIIRNADTSVSLREVEDITVEPEEQRATKENQVYDPTLVMTRTQPATLALVIHRPHNVEDVFDFQDASTADRVAKAFSHAVELCGGGNKDPF